MPQALFLLFLLGVGLAMVPALPLVMGLGFGSLKPEGDLLAQACSGRNSDGNFFVRRRDGEGCLVIVYDRPGGNELTRYRESSCSRCH
jgi:hypothetical protein